MLDSLPDAIMHFQFFHKYLNVYVQKTANETMKRGLRQIVDEFKSLLAVLLWH